MALHAAVYVVFGSQVMGETILGSTPNLCCMSCETVGGLKQLNQQNIKQQNLSSTQVLRH